MESLELQELYVNGLIKEQVANRYRYLNEAQVDMLLENNNISVLEEEVLEELFGKTRAKLAGAKANLGARASNLGNQISTGAQNMGAKAGAIGNNVKSMARGAAANVMGQNAPNDANLVDVNQVGNNQAQQVDPNQAANAAKLQSIIPQVTQMLSKTFTQIQNDLNSLGLDAATLEQLNPEVGKAITNGMNWLKWGHNAIVKSQNGQNQGPTV